jgi:long-chain acyl-CoA synthetase
MDPTRLFDFYYYQLEKFPQSDAVCSKVNGEWKKHSIRDIIDMGNRISKALLKMGVEVNDKIGIISNNRTEWNVVDLGVLQVGAQDVPIYPTASEADYKYIFNDAEIKYCFVSDEELYEKVMSIKGDVPSLKEVYTFEKVKGAKNWTEVLELGKEGDMDAVKKRMENVKPEDLATLIYTSGTTGTPKGVMLSHQNISSNSVASRERLPVDETAKAVSFLPLCHIYERMLIYLYVYTGVSLYYAESLDTIGDDIRDVKPQVFTAVPRLLEKVYDKIIAKGAELSGIKKALFFWAVELGREYDVVGRSAWYNFRLKIARKLIFSKWQEALGGNVEAVASGSAALNPNLARIFLAAGIPIFEGYGLTETSPVVTVNGLGVENVRIGTVGRTIKDVEVKIAEDGEILVKGPNVMMGYYNKPDKTAEVMTDGWFHTGDIGEITGEGYLKITDRKKEIFKTSGGKYIAPQIMENAFKQSRFIEQIMVIGEGQKHPAAFVQPDFVFLKEWCRRHDINYTTDAEMVGNERIIERIGKEIEHYNAEFGKWEKIKKFELTPEAWSIDGGELTPTLKLRRKQIREKYMPLYNKIYDVGA